MKKCKIPLGLLTLVMPFLLIISCENPKKEIKTGSEDKYIDTSIKYANGFDIQYFNGYRKLIIKSPYPDAEQYQEFILISDKSKDVEGENKIYTPVKKVVATSTTHIPMIDILNETNSLIGFPNTDYISSQKTRERVEQGKVTDLGNEQDFNTEVLISLQPDVMIAFSMGKSNKLYNNIEKNGIPVVFNGDWLEASPLGRAEWIKFFGALFDREREADSIFKSIESQYLEAKKLAQNSKTKPKIMSGVLYKDKWNLPAGESFTAQLYRDANTEYIWDDTKGQGSLVLSFETVYEKAQLAELWIGSGYYTTMEELKGANAHYSQFKAFKDGEVYSFSKRRSSNGGVEYFELGPLQPHIVLKDLIKVAHPEILPNYRAYFLQKLD
ncbi:ABC transporter substrate-binding protein [Lutimonas vermicola]|uniref:ABC transporter substrate-binding protein n=1 Tax=Lutimonas vermicola TaxID=414288 RepID=A0ABU9KZ72_9FLAO